MSEKERRHHPRTEFSKPVTIEATLSTHGLEAVGAELLDISSGGACIMTNISYDPGGVVKLNVPLHGTNIHIPSLADVRWVTPVDDGFKLGLHFLA